MSDQFLRIGGRDSNGNARPLKTDNNGVVETKVTGSNPNNSVDRLVVFDAVELRSTSEVHRRVNISKYKKILVFASNSHNQPVRVDFRFDTMSSSRFWNGDSWVRPRINLPGGGHINSRHFLNTALPFLSELAISSSEDSTHTDLNIFVDSETAPTSGAFTLIVMGVPNV